MIRPSPQQIDVSELSAVDATAVLEAIARGENFHPLIPSECLSFVIRNYSVLGALGVLEPAWLDAYVHTVNFNSESFATVKAVFDKCDREKLRSLKPVSKTISQSSSGRVTVFRGCAGPNHTLGMSWIRSLDKAIWYAANHMTICDLTNPAVYVATVCFTDIYCQLDHYDEDLIVVPRTAWKIDVPQEEFRIDRPR